MRIAFLGKGGSGKTTLAAGLISHYASRRFVLAVDADINSHLQNTLGIEKPAPAIGGKFAEVGEYLKGSREDLQNTNIVATTPPSLKSKFVTVQNQSDFIEKFGTITGNIGVINIGSFEPSDIGHTCYHGKLNTLELIYHHMLDTEKDLVVADGTAGIDNLGTSLFMAYDLNIFVVEPTLKSIQVYLDFVTKAKTYSLKTKVIVNKYTSEDLEFIQKYIPKEDIIGYISLSSSLKQFEQGEREYFEVFKNQNEAIFSSILREAFNIKKDWNNYLKLLLQTHKLNSLEWWDDYYHQEISKQFDPKFSYSKAIENL